MPRDQMPEIREQGSVDSQIAAPPGYRIQRRGHRWFDTYYPDGTPLGTSFTRADACAMCRRSAAIRENQP